MGSFVAILNKKGHDVTQEAIAMLRTIGSKNAEAYGIASQSKVRIEASIDDLRTDKDSSLAIGYVFKRILKQDTPQPIVFDNATAVFDGRTYPQRRLRGESAFFDSMLCYDRVENAKRFIAEAKGDFAFAIAESKRIIGGRDPLGVRPLYYGEEATHAGLASEQKALWSIGLTKVNSFPPGHVTVLSKNGFEFIRARMLTRAKPQKIAMRIAAEKLQILLERAVRERVSGLENVAVAFSGGLDSCLIALLAKQSEVNVDLIHVSLENQSETDHAMKTAHELDLPFHYYTYTDLEVQEALPEGSFLD